LHNHYKSPSKTIDNSFDNAGIIVDSKRIRIEIGGQVCVSEGCGGSYNAQPSIYMQETNDKVLVLSFRHLEFIQGDYKNLEVKNGDNT
jgi:hypothetical protein